MPDNDIATLIKEHRILLEYAIKEVIAQFQAQETHREFGAANGAHPDFPVETFTGGIAVSDGSVEQNSPNSLQAAARRQARDKSAGS